MSVRQAIKSLTPPLLWDAARRYRRPGLRFSGRPGDWAQARAMSSGYSAQAIVERVVCATREVETTGIGYERDSVILNDGNFPFQVLTALLRGAALGGGRLSVIDFGGSLGSTYRQCRPFLKGLPVQWQVVEQDAFVTVGHSEFATSELTFKRRLEDLDEAIVAPTVLLSSVLQYLEHPWQLLRLLASGPASVIAIDRTPMMQGTDDRLCIQHVPTSIYDASYPCWLLSRSAFARTLGPEWAVLADYAAAEGSATTEDGTAFEFRGLILERRA